jgi:hypothetical protein
MSLPFTADAFFEVFARYNEALWPVVVGLWLAAAAALVTVIVAPGARSNRMVTTVLVALWVWGGVVYHAMYFTSINPAAWGFAALFVVEAGLIARYGLVRRQLAFGAAGTRRWAVGVTLAIYALAYPALNLLAEHTYRRHQLRRALSSGDLHRRSLMTLRRPESPSSLPLLWSLIGGSAALLLGMMTDYALLACAVLLVADRARTAPAPPVPRADGHPQCAHGSGISGLPHRETCVTGRRRE